MALSDDQRAMLRLLAQREQGYEDMASLMGLSVEQVREKVKEALEEIDSADPDDKPVAPAPAAVSTPAPTRPPAPEPQPAPAAPRPSPSPRSKPSLPNNRRLVQWVGGVAIVVLIVLFATGTVDIGGGDSDSSSNGSAESSPENGATGAVANLPAGATKAVLRPVDGSDAAGLALFGRLKKTAVLQVEAKGLRPSPKGQSYTVWLYSSPKLALRIGAVAVGKNGLIAAQFPLPPELLAVIAGGAFDQIDISLTPNSDYEAEVAQAKQQKRLPLYTGTDILRGKITGPAVG